MESTLKGRLDFFLKSPYTERKTFGTGGNNEKTCAPNRLYSPARLPFVPVVPDERLYVVPVLLSSKLPFLPLYGLSLIHI